MKSTKQSHLAVFYLFLLALPAPGLSAQDALRFDFETGAGQWEVIDYTGSSRPPELQQIKDTAGNPTTAAKLDAVFPGETGICLPKPMNWTGYERLSVDVFLPQEAPNDCQLIAYVRDADLNWYQAIRLSPLPPGMWSTVTFDASDTSERWAFKGHFRPWDGYVKQEIQELGLKLISKKTYKGTAFLDNVRLTRISKPTTEPIPPELINFRTNVASPGRYEKFEITFNVTKTYNNPFDPREVDIQCTFISPSGQVTVVPAFYYQGYIRSVERRTERLIPVGRSEWKVRFTPTEVGTYRYFIDLRDGTHVRTAPRSFEVLPSNKRGFVRISKSDPRYFEFDNKEFFYPIGHNICASFDVRNAEQLGINLLFEEGTSAYDRYLNGMARGGETLGRVWMTCWAFAIEWSPIHSLHYRGLGRYSMQNAWRIDYLLDLAERNGIYLMFTFDNHGHWNTSVESNWAQSPYNVANGGILQTPVELFYNPEATRLYKQRIRYIMSRWGYSTAVFSWEIFNEIDLAREYYHRNGGKNIKRILEWEKDIAHYIRQIDQGKHIITSNRYNWEKAFYLWQQPEIEYTSAHLFGATPISLFEGAYRIMSNFDKIFLITECASDIWGGSPEETEKFMHAAIWTSHMMPFAAPAMPWWWTFIDERDLYFHFKALANFAQGEDRRGKNLRVGEAIITRQDGGEIGGLGVRCLQNDKLAYCWIFDHSLMDEELKPRPPDPSLILVVTGLTNGDYRVEFWDTYKGVPIGTAAAKSTGGMLKCPLPPFRLDIACKIKKQ